MALLAVENIGRQEGEMDFTQQPLEKIAIAGETGSGKTTLLKMIAGLMQPTSGQVLLEGKRVLGPDEQLIAGHKSIAYLSQYFELRNNYWVYEVLEYANKLTQEEAENIYAVCRIGHLLQRRTSQLSGGERQRVALARLLTTAPKLLLLDEPFSNLDLGHKSIIKKVIADITAKLSITCIMASHEAPDMLAWADTILVMKQGQLLQKGKPEAIYRQPMNEYCAALFGPYNLFDAGEAKDLIHTPTAENNGKQLLVRPEQFIIAPPGSKGICGEVAAVSFCGSYYTIEINTGSRHILVNTGTQKFTAGEKVCLSLNPADAWFV
jgi:ABC-type Fe3+/spermidine/putrescine transport system ATPase subunit